jgi:hypothetical protein
LISLFDGGEDLPNSIGALVSLPKILDHLIRLWTTFHLASVNELSSEMLLTLHAAACPKGLPLVTALEKG